jgi:hypothetical protein
VAFPACHASVRRKRFFSLALEKTYSGLQTVIRISSQRLLALKQQEQQHNNLKGIHDA